MKKTVVCFFLCVIMSLFTCASACAEPLTPEQAVSEMTWGVNLTTLYMADKVYDEGGGNNIGYSNQAPMGIGIWFWEGSYDWLVPSHLHDPTFSASVKIPDYTSRADGVWFDGMFELGVFLTDVTDLRATFLLENTRIITAAGKVYPLDINGEYTAVNFGEYNANGYAGCQLQIDAAKLPEPSEEFNGARLETTVTLIDVPYSETGKVDYFYQYQQEKVDQYELTNVYLDQGVNVFRLPVTWTQFVQDQEPFTVDREWLDAVRTEVDYIISRGAYCILNMHDDYLIRSYVGDHWEDAWMLDEYKDYVDRRFQAVWAQIAEYFKDYPSTLIFETANEPAMDWDLVSQKHPELDSYVYSDLIVSRNDELNQMMVNTVRGSGGNNDTRLICLSVGNYDAAYLLKDLAVPDDEYLIAQIHSYKDMEDNDRYVPADPDFDYVSKVDTLFADINNFTARTGVPVLIGEVGLSHRVDVDTRKQRTAYYFQHCLENNVPALWWEDCYHEEDGYYFWLYDLERKTWEDGGVLETIQDIYGIDPGEKLDQPDIRLNYTELPFGEVLEVSLTGIDQDATSVGAYLIASDQRTAYSDYEINWQGSEASLRFPSEMLPLGEYRVVTYVRADGRFPGYASEDFVILPNGALDTPVLHGVPAAAVRNQPLEASFDPVEGAENYYVELAYFGDNPGGEGRPVVQYSIRSDEENANILSFDGDMLNEVGIYRLLVVAEAKTKHSAESEQFFQIIESAKQTLTLTIEGERGTVFDWPAQKDFRVRLVAPGATAIRILDPWMNWNYWNGAELDDFGSYTWWQSVDKGTYRYVAQAAYDEAFEGDWDALHWTDISNEVSIQVNSERVSDEAVYSIPQTVNRGELLPVTITDGGARDGRPVRFRAYFVDDDGNHYGNWLDTGWVSSMPVTLYLPTGQETVELLHVCVEAAGFGCDAYRSDPVNVRLNQNVSLFSFDVQNDILESRPFSVSAWCPGASSITLWIQEQSGESVNFGDYSGEYIDNVNIWIDKPGRFVFYAIAHFSGNPGKEIESEHLTRQVSYIGELEEVTVLYPTVLPAGNELAFAVHGLDQTGLDYWEVNVYDKDWDRLFRWDSNSTDGVPESFLFYDLTPDEQYTITVYIDGAGYPGIGRDFPLQTSSGYRVLHLPEQLQVIERYAFSGAEAVSLTVPDGIQRIEADAFTDSQVRYVFFQRSVGRIDENAFDDDVIVFGYPESSAKSFAESNGLAFVSREQPKAPE